MSSFNCPKVPKIKQIFRVIKQRNFTTFLAKNGHLKAASLRITHQEFCKTMRAQSAS